MKNHMRRHRAVTASSLSKDDSHLSETKKHNPHLVFRLGSALERWHLPLVLSWWHLLTLFLLQAESTLVYGIYPIHSSFLFQLMLRQGNLFAVALLLVFVSWQTLGGSFAVVVIFCANLFCICEHVAFKLNGVHTRPSMTEQATSMHTSAILLGSFYAELDAVFLFNIVGLFAATFLLIKKILLPCGTRSMRRYIFHRFSLLWVAGCLLNGSYTLLSCVLFTPAPARLEPHPMVVFFSDLALGSRAAYDGGGIVFVTTDNPLKNSMLHPEFVDAPIFGDANSISPREHTWLNEIRKAVHTDRSTKNLPLVVVSVVLESVGATNVFPKKNGVFDSSLTPTLAMLQKQGGIVFDNHHDYYPSTTRSHVPMFTGGPTTTMGSLSEQLAHKYEGPTLMKWLKEKRFCTGLFAASDLEFENLATWYRHLGFDRFHHYGIADEAFKKANVLNSWGGNDHSMYTLAAEWIEEELARSRSTDDDDESRNAPIFVHLLPDATHHPYSVPKNYLPPETNKNGEPSPPLGRANSRFRYNRALRYTDMALGQMRSRLDAMGLTSSRVLFVISGDHGEAFGTPAGHHANNFLHKNHVFEENIRSFVLLHGPALQRSAKRATKGETVAPAAAEYRISHRVSRVIDVFPTITSFISGDFSLDPKMLSHHQDEAVTAAVTAAVKIDDDGNGDDGDGGDDGGDNGDGSGEAVAEEVLAFPPGQNLLSSDWSLRLAFFHRMGEPSEWGVLDGRYKFIEDQRDFDTSHIDPTTTAVYDLVKDPEEKINLASLPRMKARIAKWRSATIANFWVAHCSFTTRLANYQVARIPGSGCAELVVAKRRMKELSIITKAARPQKNLRRPPSVTELKIKMPSATRSGPNSFMFGSMDNSGVFQRTRTVDRHSKKVVAFTEWIPFLTTQKITMEWRLLNHNFTTVLGKAHSNSNRWRWTIEIGWHTTYFNIYPNPSPMVPGTWELVVWSKGGNGPAMGRQSVEVV